MDFPEKGIYFLFDPINWKKQPWKKNIAGLLSYICALQLRCSGLNDRELHNTAIDLKNLLTPHNIPLIINNRLDIASDSGAAGVHLGESDMPLPEAKRCFNGIIGASRHSILTSKTAEKEGADYIGCGPVFNTETKLTGREMIGKEGFLEVKKAVGIPVIPIGGINKDNIDELKDITKIVAVSSTINLSPDPISAAQYICKSLNLEKI